MGVELQFSRAEEASMVMNMAQAFYVAHVHAGRPHMSLALAVEMAAKAFGLVQSEKVHRMAESARTAPHGVAKALQASWSALAQQISDDQDARATRVIAEMNVNQEL